MRISNRTLIETIAAGTAVGLLAEAYLKNASLRKTLLKSRDTLTYLTDVLVKRDVPMDQFDSIAIHTIIDD